MNADWQSATLAGVVVYLPSVTRDHRGFFVKTFHDLTFARQGVQFTLKEEFYSVSTRDVLRGMHFQIPPHDHAKMVTCFRGRVLDVLLDLRRSHPTYGKTWSTELSEDNHAVLYIPSGVAHGFLVLSEEALVHYKTSSVHQPASDKGIRWDSFGHAWPVKDPILSERDKKFPGLAEFQSPF
jgi:dTDP-4-dehydrorhamnose 3,5-epimerase